MFDFIRTHQRLMQFILLLLIVPSFVFFGIQGYERMNQRTQEVAKVGSQTITQAELDDAQRQQLDRTRQQLGGKLDVAALDTPEARAKTLEGLIAQRVLSLQASRQSLGVSDTQLQRTILAIPGLNEGGRFDTDRYRSILAQQGMTPTVFEARLRQDLAIQQLGNAVEQSAVAPKSVVDRLLALSTQRRGVGQAVLKASDFVGRVQLAPDAVQKDYDAHPADHVVPESVAVEYVSLDADLLAKQVKVPDEQIRDFYEQNKTVRYSLPETRRASHILVAVSKDASDADKAKARAKADDLLAKLRANPGDFAKLAKQSSDDPGSAAKGGDLDYLGRGATVPPFEAALFAQKKDEIGDVVQSDFGYHIIKVTDVKAGSVKPFDAVRPEIEQEIGKQLAQKKFTDTAEAFANSVYEQGESLAPTAKTFGLQVMNAANVTRVPSPSLPPNSPLANARLLAALFTPDSLKTRHNTEAIETSPGTLVSARVVDVKPATTRPLAEVEASIRARLVAAEARKLAEAAGQAKLAELKAGNAQAVAFSADKAVPRLERSELPVEAVEAIYRVDRTKLPAYAGVTLANGDYAIYRVSTVDHLADADTSRRADLAQSLERATGSLEFAGYLDDLRRRSKVKVFPPYAELIDRKPAPKTGS